MRFKGRGLSKGIVEGKVILSRKPVSFLGGVDPETGTIMDKESDILGESVAGRVFAFPQGKGSTVGSYVIFGLATYGRAPLAILNERSEVIVAVGAIISEIPLIDGIDLSFLRTGDTVMVNADEGWIEVKGVKEKHVVTSIIENNGEILILKRSEHVRTYQGKWAGVSGYLEAGEKPLERAIIEIEEEVGLKNVDLIQEGESVISRDHDVFWIIHPFLFHSSSRDIVLDWEHTQHAWVKPRSIPTFDSVPRLEEVVKNLWSRGRIHANEENHKF